MAATLDEALDHLNVNDTSDFAEIEMYVDAANEWIAERVSDTSPTPVKLATLFLIGHWWESQRGPTGTPVDDGSEIVVVNGRAFAIPNRVLELLGSWLLDNTPAPTHSFPEAVAYPDPVEWA